MGLLRRSEQELRGPLAGLLLRRGGAQLEEVEGPRESVVRLVRRQDSQGLAARLDLLLARLHALLVLGVGHLARLLEVHQELLVRAQRVARVLKVLLRLRVRLVRVRKLLRLRVALLRAGLDLLLL